MPTFCLEDSLIKQVSLQINKTVKNCHRLLKNGIQLLHIILSRDNGKQEKSLLNYFPAVVDDASLKVKMLFGNLASGAWQ